MAIRVTIEGSKELITKLQVLKSADLSRAWANIAQAIKWDAVSITPILSGILVRSIRESKTKNKATVRAGGAGMEPYAGVIHYGGYNNIQAQPFLTPALYNNVGYARKEVSDELDDIIRRLGLR